MAKSTGIRASRFSSTGRRRWVISGTVAFLAGTALGLAATAAAAVGGYTESLVGYFTYSGHQYNNKAYVSSVPNNALAGTGLGPTAASGYTAPSGWLQVKGRLFDDTTGSEYCESGFLPNGTATGPGKWIYAGSCNALTHGLWYSYGVTKVFDGYNWAAYYTLRSGTMDS
jgi:hypothetical protein